MLKGTNHLCILQDSTSTLHIFNNILSYVTSIPLSTIFILRICPSFCLISVGGFTFNFVTYRALSIVYVLFRKVKTVKRNNNFIAVKTPENTGDYACCKSVTAGLHVGALLSQTYDCRAQRVNFMTAPTSMACMWTSPCSSHPMHFATRRVYSFKELAKSAS